MPGAPATRIAGRLRWQADWCERLGSPLYAELLRRSADDVEGHGPAWRVLEGHQDDPERSHLPLRLMGSVHRLVLEGRAPRLATEYPSVGGTQGDPWPAFRAVLEEQRDEVRRLLPRPVQTNEVGRAAILLGGFLEVARRTALPLRLLEIGASAGLLLRWERYRYASGGRVWGDPSSAVRFDDVFTDGRPPDAEVNVVARRGCDLEPVDPTTDEGRLTLLSYVWADQVERLTRVRAALDVARHVPAPVDRADAVPWLAEQLGRRPGGVATVVFHSIVLMYLDQRERGALTRLMEDAGARARHDQPLAWLSFEMAGDAFETTLRLWPGGEERVLARSGPHGPPVTWLGRAA